MTDTKTLIKEAIQAYKSEDKPKAKSLLLQVIESDERSEQAWMWMSAVVESSAQRQTCLENVLNINPANERAQKGLRIIYNKLGKPDQPMPTGGGEIVNLFRQSKPKAAEPAAPAESNAMPQGDLWSSPAPDEMETAPPPTPAKAAPSSPPASEDLWASSGGTVAAASTDDPWDAMNIADPWASGANDTPAANDPWTSGASTSPATEDPWSGVGGTTPADDPWAASSTTVADPWAAGSTPAASSPPAQDYDAWIDNMPIGNQPGADPWSGTTDLGGGVWWRISSLGRPVGRD